MNNIPILLIFVLAVVNNGLSQFTGSYTASVNGDQVQMTLQQSGSSITGSMKDSQQSYTVSGLVSGSQLDAQAIEPTYGITIFLIGNLSGDNINMEGSMDVQGVHQKAFSALFSRVSRSDQSTGNAPSKLSPIPAEVKSKSIDSALIGLWREESHYNSSGFSGSTYTYSSFNADHTMSDHGSQANISGTDYSGSSGGQTAANVIPNIWYYTSGGKIWVYILENGQYNQAELGSYYIESSKMLFTQANTGKKILYYKQ